MKLSTSPHKAMGAMFGASARFVKCTAVLIPVLMMSVAGVSAQEATQAHLDAAKAAINASKTTVPLDGILPSIAIRTKTTLIDARPDLADRISDVVDNASIELASRRGDLEGEIAHIYVRVFTEKELTEIANFYGSETGQKLLSEAPIIERQIKESSRTWGAGIQRDLNQTVSKKLKEMEKKPSE
ncbi:MAG: DUF2059 domain-containing protein [Rhizobiaceae bacterium]|nr:DUF2059 domain-containing protein [Rhizobiaceae bacterium]